MNDEMHFGELEETVPQRQLRPDQNRHYAVVAYGEPTENELPIYVDIDVAREMEAHALSNTNVELGGVLLGGHYEDEDGNEFVVITDSLRAEHYEATKGSFKFTHETWSDITRKREQFPEDTHMVGWYHTHPGWGVFLSGMDTFICEHFFNKPLDVALVIDPCQGERAYFQWTSQEGTRETRVTGGFYLTASRFRLPELEIFAAQLEGTIAMPTDPRHSGLHGAYPPPVVQIAESRQTWLSIAVLGMLLMQFSVLALIAWRLLTPVAPASVATYDPRAAELQAERKLLDDIIGELKIAPDGVVQALEQQRKQNEEMRTVRMGLAAHIREMTKEQKSLKNEGAQLANQVQELKTFVEQLKEERGDNRAKIAALKEKLEEYEELESEEGSKLWAWVIRWKWYLSAGALLVLITVATLFAIYATPEQEAQPPSPSEPIEGPPED